MMVQQMELLHILKNLNNSKIKYFWSDNSGGPAKPRNDGINFAQSNWICFLDADDTWYQTKLVNIKKFWMKMLLILYVMTNIV